MTEPRGDGRWGWRLEAVRDALDAYADQLVFLAGCSEEQALVDFDRRVLLTAAWPTIASRLASRTNNSYGRSPGQLDQVRADQQSIEPLLRDSADLVLDTTEPVQAVAARLLGELDLGGDRSG